MTLQQKLVVKNAVNGFLLNTKAKTTKSIQKLKLSCFCKFMFDSKDLFNVDWTKLDKENILRFIDYKTETIQFSTANNYITILKIFAKECFYHGVIDSLTYSTIKHIQKYKGTSPDNGRALKPKEIEKVKLYFSKARNGRELRNYAIFALGVGCGLRRAEISALNIEHLKGRKLQVSGKGNKSRTTYLSNFTFNAVMAWRKQLSQKKGALFVHVTKGDRIKNERLGIKGVHYVISDIKVRCNLTEFTTHDLRRTFATTLLHANIDVFTVQELLGHSDPMTTKRYDKRGEYEKIKAIKSLPF